MEPIFSNKDSDKKNFIHDYLSSQLNYLLIYEYNNYKLSYGDISIVDGNKFILISKDKVINELFSNHLENIKKFCYPQK